MKLNQFPLRRFVLALITGAVTLGAQAQPQPYPQRAVTLVIPSTAGGNHDAVAREIGRKLSESLGWPVVIEPKPGGNGVIAANHVLNAPADGHVVYFAISQIALNGLVRRNVPYKMSDFTPVSQIAGIPLAMAASVHMPFKDFKGYLAAAKAEPGKYTYGSLGTGGSTNIVPEALHHMDGVQVTHVPYNGEAALFPDLQSGRISVALGSAGFFGRQANGGQLKLLAVASEKRLRDFPELPTFAELGYPQANLPGWSGMFVSSRVPKPVVERLEKEFVRIVGLPEIQEKIHTVGMVPLGTSSHTFVEKLKTETANWSALIQRIDYKPD